MILALVDIRVAAEERASATALIAGRHSLDGAEGLLGRELYVDPADDTLLCLATRWTHQTALERWLGADPSPWVPSSIEARVGTPRVLQLEGPPATMTNGDPGPDAELEARVGQRIQALRSELDERGRVEEELRRSNADLEQFAYVASHDLQEPLRMVVSYLQLLERRYRGQLDSDADEFIGFAVDGARRMQVLIDDLLTYSRVGRRGSHIRPVEAGLAVDAAVAALEGALRESGGTVHSGDMPIVLADASQLRQVFQNLIGNAIKFRRPGHPPTISVTAEREGRCWRFAVRDDGIGIAPEYHDRVFVIFQRLHGRDAYPGTGIGLAITKRIVERHGGRIWVESATGQGATFSFSLPDGASEVT